MKPLLNEQTVEDLYKIIHARAKFFNDKYQATFSKENYFKYKSSNFNSIVYFYRQSLLIYSGLSDLLFHLHKYGTISSDKCLSCKFEGRHRNKMLENYKRFKSLILKLKDGEKYEKFICA